MANFPLHLISASPLLNCFSEKELNHMLENRLLGIKEYKKNTTIHFDGEPCNKLEIILEGEVVVNRLDEEGEILTITTFSSGDILGGNILFSSTPMYLMTISSTKDCLLLEIDKDPLFLLLSTKPLFLRAYLEFISDVTTLLGNTIKNSVKKPLRESLLNYFAQEYKRTGSPIIHLKVTKKKLAEMMGVQRTSLSRELKKMKDHGLIDVDQKTITLHPKTLSQLIKN